MIADSIEPTVKGGMTLPVICGRFTELKRSRLRTAELYTNKFTNDERLKMKCERLAMKGYEELISCSDDLRHMFTEYLSVLS